MPTSWDSLGQLKSLDLSLSKPIFLLVKLDSSIPLLCCLVISCVYDEVVLSDYLGALPITEKNPGLRFFSSCHWRRGQGEHGGPWTLPETAAPEVAESAGSSKRWFLKVDSLAYHTQLVSWNSYLMICFHRPIPNFMRAILRVSTSSLVQPGESV